MRRGLENEVRIKVGKRKEKNECTLNIKHQVVKMTTTSLIDDGKDQIVYNT